VVVNDELLGFALEDGRFISLLVAFFRRWRWPRRKSADVLKSTARRFIGRNWTPTSGPRVCWSGRKSIITTRAKPWNAPSGWDGFPRPPWKKRVAFHCNLLDRARPAQTRRHPHGKFQPAGEGKGGINAKKNILIFRLQVGSSAAIVISRC
jgi:hypothetical protein